MLGRPGPSSYAKQAFRSRHPRIFCAGGAPSASGHAQSQLFIVFSVLVGAPDLVIYRGFCETRVAGGAPSASGHAKSQLFVTLLYPSRSSGPRDLRRILRKTRSPSVLQRKTGVRGPRYLSRIRDGGRLSSSGYARNTFFCFCFGLYFVIYRTEIRRPSSSKAPVNFTKLKANPGPAPFPGKRTLGRSPFRENT